MSEETIHASPGFGLTQKQANELYEWKEAIKKVFGEYGDFEFRFTPTGIGVGLAVHSSLADKVLELTDYDSW